MKTEYISKSLMDDLLSLVVIIFGLSMHVAMSYVVWTVVTK